MQPHHHDHTMSDLISRPASSPGGSDAVAEPAAARVPSRRAVSAGPARGMLLPPAAARPTTKQQRQHLSVSQYTTASADALQEQVQHVGDVLGAVQVAFAAAQAAVHRSTGRIEQLQQQIKSLQDEDAALSAKAPLPINRVCRVRQWLADKVASLDAEQAALGAKQLVLLEAESRLRAQETEASLLAEVTGSLTSAAAADKAAALRNAAAVRERDVAAVQDELKQLAAAQRQTRSQASAQQQAAEARDRAAQQLQAEAQQRLRGTLAGVAADAAVLADSAASRHSRHWRSLLALKDKLDTVREGVARRAEQTRELRKQRHELEQKERDALLEQGLNPYEVWRVRAAEAAAAQAADAVAAAQQCSLAQVAAVLAAEAHSRCKQQARAEYDRQVEQEYLANMGITAQQARTAAYMRGHTRSHTALLDPTSRLPVYPSDAVDVKPASFGMGLGRGKVSPEAVEKVAARLRATEGGSGAAENLADCVLLPRRCRPTAAQQQQADDGATTSLQANTSGSDSDGMRNVDGSSSSSSQPVCPRQTGGPEQAPCRAPLQLAVTKLSKLEAARLQDFKRRHRATVLQPGPKVAFGSEFGSDAFIADPPALLFQDCVPGQTYTAAVRLINRGFTGNNIRLREVPAEVAHVLELDMPPSGALAPGTCATLRATFRPRADEPLEATIQLLAESGPVTLPFKALARRALPRIEPCPRISLDGRAGGVMLGASVSTPVTISNDGVLDVMYDIRAIGPLAAAADVVEAAPAPVPADASEQDAAALQDAAWAGCSVSVGGLRIVGSRGRVRGYSSHSFSVEFTPTVRGPVQVPVQVSFTVPTATARSGAPKNALAVPPAIQLVLAATGRELPVSVLTPLIDFQCVMHGQRYAAPLVLANSSKAAMKVAVKVGAKPQHADCSQWLDISPAFGFIQANDEFTVSISVKPTPSMLTSLAAFLVAGSDDTLRIPLHISVPGQPLPLRAQVQLQATTSDLLIRPASLDFGVVPLTEAAGLQLVITNPSHLPQRFAFCAKPRGLKLLPASGYGCVLPQDSVTLLATFQPPIPGPQSFELVCRTTAGRGFKVGGAACGLQPDVQLSSNVVRFSATAQGDSRSASVVLRNASASSPQLFAFGVPAGSHLRVTPRVGLLPIGGSVRVQLDFLPPSSSPLGQQQLASNQCQAAGVDQPAASGVPAGSSPSCCAACCNEWLLPCFLRPAGPDDEGAAGNTVGSSRRVPGHSLPVRAAESGSSAAAAATSIQVGTTTALHLQVSTCVVPQTLHLVAPPDLPLLPGRCAPTVILDFGALPVGSRCTRQLLLENTAPDAATLSATLLDPCSGGAFALCNALRPMAPCGGRARVLLAFCPPACGAFEEMIEVRASGLTPRGCVRVYLRGRGITPTLSVSPPAALLAAEGVSFGDCLLSDEKHVKLQLTNTTEFAVSWATRFLGPPPPHPLNGPLPGQQPAKQPVARAPASWNSSSGQVASKVPVAPVQTQPQQAAPCTAAGVIPPQLASAASPHEPSGCFSAVPSGGNLQPGESVELTVSFSPLGSGAGAATPAAGSCVGGSSSRGGWGPLSPGVQDRLQIVVPHQQQDLVVPLRGNTWPDSVFLANAVYAPSRSSGGDEGSSSEPALQDPFAAMAVAAAVAAAAGAPQPQPGSKGKSGAVGGASAASQASASQQQQQLAAALAAAGYSYFGTGYVTLPGPVAPGASSSATLDFGTVRPSSSGGGGGGGGGELVLDELPADARAAGWSVEPPNGKVSAPAGERRPLVVRFSAPPPVQLKGSDAGALLELGAPVTRVLRLGCTLRGGCAPTSAGAAVAAALLPQLPDGSRRMTLVCSCTMSNGSSP